MSIRFNRPFSDPIKALSFDLDDTLYYNGDVIRNAIQVQFDTICQLIPSAKTKGPEFWEALKWQVAKSKPEVCHDVNLWRHHVLDLGLASFGIEQPLKKQMSKQIYNAFYDARSDFTVPQQTFDVLGKLSEKYPLVAVTNGNADYQRIGLAPYFVGYYRAGENGTRMKPYPDMLKDASKDLNIPCENILHLGDSAPSDIQAALNANCPSLWFNPDNNTYPTGFTLANGEYSDLDDLLHLL
ncbi:MAG: putative hydrolase of the HAD superfamily [Psychrosphaera sp.]